MISAPTVARTICVSTTDASRGGVPGRRCLRASIVPSSAATGRRIAALDISPHISGQEKSTSVLQHGCELSQLQPFTSLFANLLDEPGACSLVVLRGLEGVIELLVAELVHPLAGPDHIRDVQLLDHVPVPPAIGQLDLRSVHFPDEGARFEVSHFVAGADAVRECLERAERRSEILDDIPADASAVR